MSPRQIASRARPAKEDLWASFAHAWEGLRFVLSFERNARIHLLAALLVVAVGFWLRLERIEWALVLFAVGIVFISEMLNTVVELVIDLVTQEHLPLAKYAKDVAAGATLVAALVAALIGLLILGPKLWLKLGL